MNQKLFWIGLSIVIATATPLAFTQTLNAALPPIPAKELNRLSDYIVVGKVNKIESRKVTTRFGDKLQYSEGIIQHKAIVTVKRLESKKNRSSNGKSKASNLPAPGKTIEVHYWTLDKESPDSPGRPPGAQGQNSLLQEKTMAKFFIRKDAQGKLHLLEPNGWQPLWS